MQLGLRLLTILAMLYKLKELPVRVVGGFFMSNFKQFIEEIKHSYKPSYWLAVGLSVLWFIFTSLLYFENLNKYPNSLDEKLNLQITSKFCDVTDDYARKDLAMEYAKKHGHGAQAQLMLDMGLRFVKPVFNLDKYLNLVFWPLSIAWFNIWIASMPTRRKYLTYSLIGSFIYLKLSGLGTIFILYSLLSALIITLNILFINSSKTK
jgi:hypothetical protein